MSQNFFDIKFQPSNWGMFGMMDRISYIQERFAIPWPQNVVKQGFQKELENSVEGAGNGQAADGPQQRNLFRPGTFPESRPPAGSSPSEDIDSIISDASKKYGVDENLLRNVIEQESGYNPEAVSEKGALGLMQLMPSTARELNVADPFNPRQNIEGGAKYLKSMLDRFDGNLPHALAAYNAGPGAVETYRGIPPYRETKNYVSSILNRLPEG